MKALAPWFLIIRRHFAVLTALALLVCVVALAWSVKADEPRVVHITLARSVSAVPLWGMGPFAEKAGFRVEHVRRHQR